VRNAEARHRVSSDVFLGLVADPVRGQRQREVGDVNDDDDDDDDD
jgi:hypothetical protein